MATVTPNDDFDAEADATALKKAMKGLGTDEHMIIRVLSGQTNEQRQETKQYFKQSYGQDLEDELKGELGGNFEDVVIAMCQEPRLYDAKQLRKAMKGAGTDEATLIEIMCSRSNDQIEEIKAMYNQEFDRDLEADLMSETSGYFRRLLVCQVTAGREEGDEADDDRAKEDAQAMYDAGEGQFGTDESEISRVLSTRSYAQLRATFDVYAELAGRDIEDAVKSEASGTLEDGWLAIIRVAKSLPHFFAKRVYNSMKGAGTDDDTLIRVIVSRSEVDLEDVKGAFEEIHEQSMKDFIEDDCGGDYKRMLLALTG